jgi:Cobalamin adenosyltransferase
MVSGIFAARSGTLTLVLNSVVGCTSPPGEEVRGTATGETPPIYTKTGDDGTTGRLFGGRVSKADPIIEAYGTLDEAVAALGLGRAIFEDERLQQVVLELQRGLFAVAAEIAANPLARERLVRASHR